VHYLRYLTCLALLTPALALAAYFGLIGMLASGPRTGWRALFDLFLYFGAGLVEPLRYGWRILGLLSFFGIVLIAGAIPALRSGAFAALAVAGIAAVAYCLAVGKDDALNVAIFVCPSIAGVALSIFFFIKLRASA